MDASTTLIATHDQPNGSRDSFEAFISPPVAVRMDRDDSNGHVPLLEDTVRWPLPLMEDPHDLNLNNATLACNG